MSVACFCSPLSMSFTSIPSPDDHVAPRRRCRSACFSCPFIERPACSISARIALGAQPPRQRERASAHRLRLRHRDVDPRLRLLLDPRPRAGSAPRPPPSRRPASPGRRAPRPGRRSARRRRARSARPSRVDSELEHRARVVVEPAHERRVDLVRARPRRRAARAPRRSARRPRRRAGPAAAAPPPSPRACRRGRRRTRAAGSASSRAADLLRQLALARRAGSCGQLVEVVGARLGRAEAAIRSRSPVARPGALEELAQQQDQLGVERRVVGADRLGADLGELAVAAGLRAPRGGRTGPSTRPSPAAAACACRARRRRGRRRRCPRGAASASGRPCPRR